MVLCAGRGERMRPFTDSCPKPALAVRGKPLLHWHLDALARAGVGRVVCNTAWLAEQVVQCALQYAPGAITFPYLDWDVVFSHEGRDFGTALETAGGICRAMPLLFPHAQDGPDDGIFWVLAADVFAPGFAFAPDIVDHFAHSGLLAHLWLVPNPAHHPDGDFGIDGCLATHASPRYTYSSLGLYRRALFAPPWCDIPLGNPDGITRRLADVLRPAIEAGSIGATLYPGVWHDVGTPQRLAALG
ncbi:sugar phosphate nucleotidyltransferase [Candidatus Symbiobacter mobilis]|uniref:Nucleoside-diphosphate-sugar pyrophosphorylase-like protein n=1 Tax=Candidatus Symbiobacter mobilis CR TaxID=946483 RepID=U5N889_9BURK|nr:sugar phosphate nucleotidyltransferase [Candidatus Symbiobacter mobilis]AGX87617.1 nucleoside-diphosphate-sugar pyrophosphorylase-like protein [Candidatus Symbiobacter mobilis CR]